MADELGKRGVKNRNGRPFFKKAIENILGNPVYMGTLRFHDISVENVHPPIISEGIFEEVQRVRQTRNPDRVPGREQSSPMLFSGLLFCGACGQKLTFERAFKPSKAYTITLVVPLKANVFLVLRDCGLMRISWTTTFLIRLLTGF